MGKTIDAKGKACPIPVIMAKKEIEAERSAFIIEVDNDIAVENMKKLARSKGYGIEVKIAEGGFALSMTPTGEAPADETDINYEACDIGSPRGTWSVFFGKDHIGEGDEELGLNLARMYFYALTQEDNIPGSIIFMNSGVKLPTHDEQTIEHLKTLTGMGVKIIVCGTCLDHYGLKDDLKVGEISNMYDISEVMAAASKVVTL